MVPGLINGRIRSQVQTGPEQSEGLSNKIIERILDTHLVRAEERRRSKCFELAHDRLIEPVQQANEALFNANLMPGRDREGAFLAIAELRPRRERPNRRETVRRINPERRRGNQRPRRRVRPAYDHRALLPNRLRRQRVRRKYLGFGRL